MVMGRHTEATYEGRTYIIPEMWLVGQMQQGKTMLEAIQWWAIQTKFAEMDSR
jgi:hypothetical protein